MKEPLAIILTTLVVMVLAVGCSKNEPETSPMGSTSQATTSTPTATETTTQPPASTITTTTTTSPTTEPSPNPGPSEPEEVLAYSWKEASDHIEEVATVTGPVISAGALLHAGLPYYFTLVLGVNDVEGVFVQMLDDLAESLPEDLYVGHTIAVTGSIIELVWKGEHTGTKIWVEDLSQIEICEEPEEVPVYSWEEASDHIEEVVTVTGPVISADRGLLYPGLNVHFTLVLGVKDVGGVFVQLPDGLVESLPEDLYVGHTIAVTGSIIELVWEGEHTGTRIWVDDLSQIEMID
jgi:hypothetical protein